MLSTPKLNTPTRKGNMYFWTQPTTRQYNFSLVRSETRSSRECILSPFFFFLSFFFSLLDTERIDILAMLFCIVSKKVLGLCNSSLQQSG